MIKPQSSMIHVRAANRTKQLAHNVLNQLGMSTSEAIRLFLHRIVTDRSFPLELKIPKKETRLAMQELLSEQNQSFETVEDLMKDLRAED